jgi:transposase-like protein
MKKSEAFWLGFLHGMIARELEELLLVTSDKHKGFK